LNHKESFFKKY